VDLLGCGDSSGDFGDATWDDWVIDIVEAAAWLRLRYEAPLWLWGLRAGCLLAVAAAARIQNPCHFLFWQPATAGKLVLQQFLRVKAAAHLADGGGRAILSELNAQLAAGNAVQVAGYCLAAPLASGLDAAMLAPTALLPGAGASEPQASRRVVWLEVSTQADANLSPAAAAALARWVGAGFAVQSSVVQGPMFWQTTEIEDAPALLATSAKGMLSEPAAA
jgi:exosortase A-associated hydrolase 2